MFDWFKKVNHAQQIDTNNGQTHNDLLLKSEKKDTLRKRFSTHISRFKGN